jgi:hypothetical protein
MGVFAVRSEEIPPDELNARQVETAKPKEKPYKMADGGGLYLLVKTNGSRYWRLKYRIDGKEKLLALGISMCLWLMPEQNVMKLEKGIAGGIDPFKKEHKAERSAGQKHLQQIALEWHSMKVKNGQLGMPLTFSKLSIKIFFLSRSTACCGHFVELLNVLKKIEARGATEKAKKVPTMW